MNWGKELRAFRQRTGLKQEAAAHLLGVSQAYVSRLENSTASPSSAARVDAWSSEEKVAARVAARAVASWAEQVHHQELARPEFVDKKTGKPRERVVEKTTLERYELPSH